MVAKVTPDFSNLIQSHLKGHLCPTYSKQSKTTFFISHMSRDMKFQTMWYVRSAKAQTNLRILVNWSEPLFVV